MTAAHRPATPADMPPQRPGDAFDRAVARSRPTRTRTLQQQLAAAARRRRDVGDEEAARLADAWLADIQRASA